MHLTDMSKYIFRFFKNKYCTYPVYLIWQSCMAIEDILSFFVVIVVPEN